MGTTVSVQGGADDLPIDDVALVDWSDAQLERAAARFVQEGIIVLPFFKGDAAARRATAKRWAERVEYSVTHATEFVTPPRTRRSDPAKVSTKVGRAEVHVLGGFGGAVMPSINHSHTARRLRRMYHAAMCMLVPFIARALAESDDPDHAQFELDARGRACMRPQRQDGTLGAAKRLRWAQFFDRVMLRDRDTSVTPEAWHRDCAEDGGAADAAQDETNDAVRVGGWIPLATAHDAHQRFVIHPGTAVWRSLYGGFAGLSAQEKRESQAAVEDLKARTGSAGIPIPLGDFMAFVETTRHTVAKSPTRKYEIPDDLKGPAAVRRLGSKAAVKAAKAAHKAAFLRAANQPQVRLFTGFELTTRKTPFLHGLQQMLVDGAAIPLKSGQRLRGYPKMYWGPPKLVQHLSNAAARLTPVMREERLMKSKGIAYWTPKETDIPSMRAQGVAAPDYSEREVEMFVKMTRIATTPWRCAERLLTDGLAAENDVVEIL